MKLTARQAATATLADMARAMDKRQPVTITYTKADGTETIRTIEIYDIRTTKAGDIILKAMDRQTGDSRTFRIDRLISYTVHRSAFILDRPAKAPAEHAPVELVSVNTPDALICREIARDDRAYWTEFGQTA
ncbi:WYL domain-containing protein [Streptomyces roseoverticillatus]|uniref:WYL domain-containing protein n=1 Tax=Streptomyces roseoverticillatus TaxID=66429 RepID=UPI001F3E049E|nr:WYL domain-containing protein [Streptomyces roseoverticillatus]MCF3101454.1 WYL domain-containing protein [Streptomyces roseoverticillatus]